MARTKQSAHVSKKSKTEHDILNVTPKTSLTVTLPAELLLHITNFIPQRLLSTIQFVCKAFDTVIRNSVRTFKPEIVALVSSINKHLLENKFGADEKEIILETLTHVIKAEQAKLEAQRRYEKKKREWEDWVSNKKESFRDAPKFTQEEKNIIKEKILDQVKFVRVNMEIMDYRYEYEAKIRFGDVTIAHRAYDEEGCNTNWSMSLGQKEADARIAVMRGESRSESVLAVGAEKMAFFKEKFGLKKLSDDAMICALILALPWGKDMNAVFYTRVDFMPQQDLFML